MIGPDGGEISFMNVTLEFPQGALTEPTYIVMRHMDRSELRVEFGPHGTQFARPVVMKLRLEGTAKEGDAENTEIKWYNPATGNWEQIHNLEPLNPNEARAELEHFSKYGDDIGGFKMQ